MLAATLAACSPEHEIDRPGTWKPTGANEANLRAMIADKRDLAGGAASYTDRGNGASRAVNRLLTDRRRPLLNVTTSQVAPPSDSQESSGGGLGGGGLSGATTGATQ